MRARLCANEDRDLSVYSYSPDTSFDLIMALLIVAPLILIGAVYTLRSGDTMENIAGRHRVSRAAQWYGYTVCLVAVVTMLISVNSLVNNIFTLADPLRESSRFSASLSSFEAYQATADRNPMAPARDSARKPMTEAEQRRRYEALRADHVAQARFDASRSLGTSGILLLVAIGLFLWHWRWLRGLAGETLPESARSAG